MHITRLNPIRRHPPVQIAGGAAVNAASCPCHAVAQQSRDQIAVLIRSTAQACEHTRSVTARSASIQWTGAAATFFRDRLAADAAATALLDDQCHDMQLLLWSGGGL
ncbi:hypothetical protein [Bifidobacterium sp.]|jgi:hypothetical protein|uniref:hypothetical protein n=1 Tax=Bifidobacterium sp. TaxID=41200 RepID=UPI0025C6E36E|nr:hypothetical protein [Bifidobacterium sp.]MCH4208673.1 hypothetical protein [Bifidobacterium sp.]MCI1224355.1 hypothetical protein [Bifidobacterium sp.]